MARLPADPVRTSVAIYRVFLVAYPSAHRREYGPLMLQMFRDFCQDAYNRGGRLSLFALWGRTWSDLVMSASAAHLEAIQEVIMAVNQAIKPMSWGKVMLVVVPGVLVAVSRIYYSLGQPAMVSLWVVGCLALAWMFVQKRLPAWGLLALGFIVSSLLLGVGSVVVVALSRLRVELTTRELLVSIPLWFTILILTWKYKPSRGIPVWILTLFIVVIVVFTALLGTNVLVTVGVMLLPVTLGLPLAQRHGSLASLFVLGAYSMWLFDSDYYSGPLLIDKTFYPLFVLLMSLLFMSVAPLFLLRARSQPGQVIGLIAPVGFALILAVAVPWLALSDFHPLRIWLGTTGLAAFGLLILALAFYLFTKTGDLYIAAPASGLDQPIGSG
jgi:hypothetical protein